MRFVLQVNGLNDIHDELYFKELFSYNNLRNVWIARDSYTHTHMGYGFVEFMTQSDMDTAVRVIHANIPEARVYTM
jgi:hypothetical protein